MRATLTEAQVQEARQWYLDGNSIHSFATNNNLPYQVIYNAVRGITYRWVKFPPPLNGNREPYTQTGLEPCSICTILTNIDPCRLCREEGRA